MAQEGIRPLTDGVSLTLTIAPRSGRDEVAGRNAGAIKIRIRAAPVEGRANESLLEFLAKRLHVPRSSLSITSGATGRRKVVRVRGISADVTEQRLFAGD